ncbi:MAG: hypothetical protein A2020_13810 [Lentisphaerae bacterium GWF2_45_14]|nr:MAG: hypothetical protein A2020_13810 [Lentisphaerae bacterium GWF2_45_14]
MAIKAQHITKSFGTFKAVDDLDLYVREGSVHGFLGPNGAGKTTVIRILLGLLSPDSAEVEILGKDLFMSRDQIMSQTGAIVEYPAFFEYMTAYENLYYLSRLSGCADKTMIEKAIDIVGLSKVRNKLVKTFSYGMKQRLGIAQAMIPENKLIFLDEPVNGLDPHGILDIRNLIRQLSENHGITVFLSSHLLSEVEQTCDYVTIIHKGHKVCEGKVSELMKQHESIEILTPDRELLKNLFARENLKIFTEEDSGEYSRFLIEGSENIVPPLVEKLVNNKIRLYGIAKHQKVLEDIFVELTGYKKDGGPDRA